MGNETVKAKYGRIPDYYTKDLGEAAALLTVGAKLLRLEQASGFYWFVFQNKNIEQESGRYWSGELQVSAKQYNDSMRTLKDRLFAQR